MKPLLVEAKRGHRRSRSAGSMKSLAGNTNMPGISFASEESQHSLPRSLHAHNTSSSSLNANKGSTLRSHGSQKQKSTLNKFFTVGVRNKGPVVPDEDGGDDYEITVNLSFFGVKKKPTQLKVLSSLLVKDVLELFLSKSARFVFHNIFAAVLINPCILTAK